MKHAVATIVAAAALSSVGCKQEANDPPVAADNTEKNKRDQSPAAVTPGDQGESESDRTITAQVRRDIVADDKLGMTAKNVKIVTRAGIVTLRGPVSTPEERANVEAHAKRVAGVQGVVDQIEIAAKLDRKKRDTMEMNKDKKAVLGLVASTAQADAVVGALKAAGFRNDDISALFPDKAGSRDFAHENNTKAPEGAVAGASAGGVIGGTLGLLAGIGALAIPGVGPLIAAGPIMAALSGVAAGAAVGGVAGGLIGLGVPEIEAKQYEGKIKDGNILLSVHVDDADWRKMARDILERHGATDVVTIGEASVKKDSRPAASVHRLANAASAKALRARSALAGRPSSSTHRATTGATPTHRSPASTSADGLPTCRGQPEHGVVIGKRSHS